VLVTAASAASSDGATVSSADRAEAEGTEQSGDDAIVWTTVELANALRRILTVGAVGP
jgi:hypothetical protein